MNRRTLLALATLGTAWGSSAWGHAGPHRPVKSSPETRGQRPLPQGLGGPLDLVDARGQRFGLERVQGRPALLFFGFTRCNATCPVALFAARELLREAPLMKAPAVLFVTLDPLSDGPREVGEYVARFDPRIIGLTGTPQQIERAADRYGVGLRPGPDGPDHSSMWYLLDGQGRLRSVFTHDSRAHDLAQGVAALSAPQLVGEVRP